MASRGLSYLAVLKGKEAEALNREIIPYIRDLGAQLADLGPKLDSVIELLTQIEQNQNVPAGGTVIGFASGIGTGANVNFPAKITQRGINIFNLDATNNLLVSLGTPGAADADTYTVKPGTLSPFLPCTITSVYNMRSSAATVSACYAGA